MSLTDIKEEDLVWSDKDFKLSDFVEIYSPPQIVKVEEGYMDSEEEERTLSASQVLTLHVLKDFKTVAAFDRHDNKISLPINSPAKLELRPSVFDNVEDLVKNFPKYVTAVEKHPWLKIEENDVLELKNVRDSFRSRVLVCDNLTKGKRCELPLAYKAHFKSLGGCPVIHPTMSDIVSHCQLPVYAKYIDNELKVVKEGANANMPFGMNVLGPLQLQSVVVNKVLLITAWEDNKVVSLPLDLDIRVVAALGALKNDHNYAKLCKIAHGKAKVEDLELMFLKEGGYKVLLEEHNLEILTKKDDVDDASDYSSVAPRVPPRGLKPHLRHQNPLPDRNSTAYNKEKRGKQSFGRSLSWHLPSKAEEVFAESTRSHQDDSRLSPVKKVFHDIKKKAIKAKKGIFNKKDDSEDYEEYDNEFSPEPGHACPTHEMTSHASPGHTSPGHVTKSHAYPSHAHPGHTSPGHVATSHVFPTTSNAIIKPETTGHASSGHAITSNAPDPSYREIKPLPGNIPADRYNDLFQQRPVAKSPSAPACKIRNPEDIRTWTIEEVAECLRYCNLDQYSGTFKKEMIDGSLLVDLDEEALRSLGINDKLHLTKMMKIIQDGWLPKY